jgi:outer membrane protein
MKRYILITILHLAVLSHVIAQDRLWTLEDCISYAITNNISLQRQRLQTETTKTNLLQSQMEVFPSLNMGSNGRITFGRSVDPVTNLITFKQNISHSYFISSGITIFNGFTTLNTIAANKFLVKAGLEAEKVQRNSLIIDVLSQYYTVIYAKGLEEASAMQLSLSEEQLFRIAKMVETGKTALSAQYEMESQVSADKLDYTIARNTSNQALTTLKQMLQLEAGIQFDVAVPDLDNVLLADETYDPQSVYQVSASTLPRLRAIEYELNAYKRSLAATRGLIAPNLTAGGQIFTGFYKVMGDDNINQISYSTQLRNNNSQAVFLSLSIPVFNNYRTGRNIKLAKLRKDDTGLRLEQEKNNLYTEIENACLDFNRGRDEFSAAQANYHFNTKSFESVEKRFESGLVDVTDFSAAKTTLFRAETEALRTKLLMIIRKLTIQFYTTGEYEGLTL